MIPRLLIVALALSGCGPAPRTAPEPSPSGGPAAPPQVLERAGPAFDTLRADFLAWYLEAFPVRATQRGVHQYDDRLPSLERGSVQLRVDDLLDWLAALEEIPVSGLEEPDRLDHAVLEFALRNELLDWEEIRGWARDPRLYTALLADGLAPLIEHPIAPPAERIASLRARLQAAPDLLTDARRNLSAPPRPWTELAIEETDALVRYLDAAADWPLARSLPGAALPSDLAEARDRLVAALEGHRTWLEEDLLPRSTGDYRLGRYLFERKLLYDQHIGLSVPELARLNEEAIEETLQELERVAPAADPGRSAGDRSDATGEGEPGADSLLAAARETLAALDQWGRAADVVSLHDEALPVVRPAPAYAAADRAWLAAPAPADSGVWRPVYYLPGSVGVSVAGPARRAVLALLTAQHTVPGDLVRARHLRSAGRLRQLLPARSLAAGWAHYAEGLAVAEGYGGGDPPLRRAELERVLVGQARWYAALHLHALDASFDDVVARFRELTGASEPEARREALRASYDPMYLAQGLGRVQILELRGDYRAHTESRGQDFSLKRFHDALLELGLPIPLARDVLIPLDDPPSTGRPPALHQDQHGRD